MTLMWVVIGGFLGGGTLRGADGSGATIIGGALVVALLAAAGGLASAVARGQRRDLVIGLVVSAVLMPTAFALPINLLVLGFAVWVQLRSRKRQSA